MNVLICTQKVDKGDDVLGFMHRWIAEFAAQAEHVEVICLYKGEVDLPANVRVRSLGKEEGKSRLTYLYRFFTYIIRTRRAYDSVFVHMNQIYILLGGFIWRLLGKKVGLWYAHGHVPRSMYLAEKLTHVVLTSTPGGFRLASKKVRVVGQGTDLEHFASRVRVPSAQTRLIMVSRLSPIKDHATLIRAVGRLKKGGVPVAASIVGGAGLPDQVAYVDELRALAETLGVSEEVSFVGSVPYERLPEVLCKADIFVNTSTTGSLDKAGLEAMASGLPVITCNDAFTDVLGTYKERLMFKAGDDEALARVTSALITSGEASKIGSELRATVAREHGITGLVARILTHLS